MFVRNFSRVAWLPRCYSPFSLRRNFTMSRLEGAKVLVTGASAGIGEACAREFAKAGANLVLTARRADRLSSLKQELETKHSIKVDTINLDVRHKANVDTALKNLEIDILVNNAGLVIGVDRIEDVTEDAIDTMLDTNVKGLLFVTQAILPGMKDREKGHIINVGSISGKQVYVGGGVYCASKHAVNALSRTLQLELVASPIRVTEINPGMVETEFSVVRFGGDKSKADAVYKGIQPLSGQDIAELVVFAATRPPHVNIQDILVTPVHQATVYSNYKISE